MLNLSHLPTVFRRLRDLPNVGAYVQEDEWRLTNAHFGPRIKPFSPSGTALLVGARSGLEAALIAECNPETNISVVEATEWGRKRVSEALGPRVTCHRSVREALIAELPEHLDFVRVELDSCDLNEIEALLQSRSVGHMCGEIDDRIVDPLTLYRLCSTRTESFFFFLRESLHSIAGTRRTTPIEVSAVLSITGHEQRLTECLASLDAQELTEFEVIVLDNAHTPEAQTLIDRFAAGRSARRVIRPASGEYLPLEAGIAVASGLYVGLLNGNTLPSPQMYSELFRAAALRGADVGESGFATIDRQGQRDYQFPEPATSADVGGVLTDVVGHLRFPPSASHLIFKRDYLNGLSPVSISGELRAFESTVFAFVAMARAGRISTVADQLCVEHLSARAQTSGLREGLPLAVLEAIFDRSCEFGDLRFFRRLLEIETSELARGKDAAEEVQASLNRRYGPILGQMKFEGLRELT